MTTGPSFTQGLRELADFLDAHPTIDTTYLHTFNVFVYTREQLAAMARLSSWAKVWDGPYFMLRKQFSAGVTLDINIAREQVCRKVVIGQRVVPAQPALPERTEDVTEWICDDSVLAEAQDLQSV